MRPAEMAPRILALDGTKEDVTLQMPEIEGIGIISDAYFHDIADAIRAQNGRTETYKPAEMAPAILAPDVGHGGEDPRAAALGRHAEFNYRDGRSSDVEGATILRAWEVDPAGYPSAGARPWDDDKALVTRAVIDADMEGSGLASAAYLFHGCEKPRRGRGIRAPHHADQHESDVRELRLAGDDLAENFYGSVETGSLMFSGCRRLVGERGYVPEQMDDWKHLHFETDGVLTHPGPRLRTSASGSAASSTQTANSS